MDCAIQILGGNSSKFNSIIREKNFSWGVKNEEEKKDQKENKGKKVKDHQEVKILQEDMEDASIALD